MKFLDIKKKFFSGSDKMDPCDDEDDSWLDEPILEVVLPEPSLKVSPFVQLLSKCLCTALSEELCVVCKSSLRSSFWAGFSITGDWNRSGP